MTPAAPPRVLYVEDDDGHAELVRAVLAGLTDRVEVAPTGDAAVDLLIRPDAVTDPFRLVILDMWVPRSAGQPIDTELGLRFLIDLQRDLCLIPPDTPIVVFTAHEGHELYNRCLLAGANYFLPKIDPRPDSNSYSILRAVCQQVLAPPPADPAFEQWYADHECQLMHDFGGRAVALSPDGTGGYTPGPDADTLPELSRLVLADPVLRWQFPRCVAVPVPGGGPPPPARPFPPDGWVHAVHWPNCGPGSREVTVQLTVAAATAATAPPTLTDGVVVNPFVFDTGAEFTFVSRRLAVQLGLPLGNPNGSYRFPDGLPRRCHLTAVRVFVGTVWVVVPALVPADPDVSRPATNLLGMAGLLDRFLFATSAAGVDVYRRPNDAA